MIRRMTFLLIFINCIPFTFADELTGRFGVGVTNQTANELSAISFKIKTKKAMAFGGLLAISTATSGGGYAAGFKLYRTLVKEPQLKFYGSVLGAIISKNSGTNSGTGFQLDGTLGTEFFFRGLESLGFSIEFGVSINKLDTLAFETVGLNIINAALHFYL